ncbi:type IV conjugative transfer system protein TraL [Pseudomonas neustonica]|uniref:type IV conjugative transfer system protein TraL n=1 Tax=Pseudomonas neustonica TaxID=2487346 RepID=UPI003F44716B|tara:strand:+ start:179 stop:469 length:291 start_codon:yes stop_codon:yes gene_type:complete
MSQEPVRIPDRIDEPPNVLFWRLDEALPIGIGLVAGILLAQLTICLLCGIVLARFYRRFCDNKPDGYLLHAVYWNLGAIGIHNTRTMPNSYEREFI